MMVPRSIVHKVLNLNSGVGFRLCGHVSLEETGGENNYSSLMSCRIYDNFAGR